MGAGLFIEGIRIHQTKEAVETMDVEVGTDITRDGSVPLIVTSKQITSPTLVPITNHSDQGTSIGEPVDNDEVEEKKEEEFEYEVEVEGGGGGLFGKIINGVGAMEYDTPVTE
jgi:hypothetical protein